MYMWVLVSISLMCILVDLVRRTCQILGRLSFCYSLRGLTRRMKFRMEFRRWMGYLFILVAAVQIVVGQLFVHGGVHIQPELLSSAIQFQAMVTCGLVFLRLGFAWRRDRIGPCRTAGTRRVSCSQRSACVCRYRAVFFCLCIIGSHATQAANRISMYSDPDISSVGESARTGPDCEDTSASRLCDDLEQRRSEEYTVLGNQGQHSLTFGFSPNDSSEMQALPEANDHLRQTDRRLSLPCEGDHHDPALDLSLEGISQQSACLGNHVSYGDQESQSSVDSRPPILGNFVSGTRAQVSLVSESGQTNSRGREHVQALVFGTEPIHAKVWLVPIEGCDYVARNTHIPVDSFGDTRAHLCAVWSDKIDMNVCSSQVVSPQPSDHFEEEILHFLVFRSQGPFAILVRQITVSLSNPRRVDFCACTVSRHNRCENLQRMQIQNIKRGDLVEVIATSGEEICEFGMIGSPVTDLWGNTATHVGDVSSFMQAPAPYLITLQKFDDNFAGRDLLVKHGDNTATPGFIVDDDEVGDGNALMQQQNQQMMANQAVTITAMRFARAVDHQVSMHEEANFASQNFVKKDELQKWVRRVMQYDGESVVLAVWRTRSMSPVTHDCDRVLLEGANWAKMFRQYWKTDELSKTPVLTLVDPQPPIVSGATTPQYHVIGIENRMLQPDCVVHLFDVWEAETPYLGTGWKFLERQSAVLLRSATVADVAEIIAMHHLSEGVQPYALYSQRDGETTQTFRKSQKLALPDCSYIHLVLVRAKGDCEKRILDQVDSVSELVFSHEEQVVTLQNRDNTATLVAEEREEQSFMQTQQRCKTAAELEQERCYDPVLTPIRLYEERESSWRLWNHYARDRLWQHPNFDEMSAWLLVEGSSYQAIPVTLFSSRIGTRSWNEPFQLWAAMGGLSDPIVYLVFPAPTRFTLPEDHLLFVPHLAHEGEQRAFLVDVVDRSHPAPHVVERVAVRGTRLSPRSIARMLGYSCVHCVVLCSARRQSVVFADDQFIRFHTGSFLTLDVSHERKSSVQNTCQVEKDVQKHEFDENVLFQFHPPQQEWDYDRSEAYFWVRRTILFQPAMLKAVMEGGLMTAGHWPLLIVHFEGEPHRSRTFGFERHQSVTMDQVRIRFRSLYAGLLSTEEQVSVGPVGIEGLPNLGVNLHDITLIAFRGRVTLDIRVALLCITFPLSIGQITTRAVRLPTQVTCSDIIAQAELEELCAPSRSACLVTTEAGEKIHDTPVRITSWQRIHLIVSENPEECLSEPSRGPSPHSDHVEEASLMQTSPVQFVSYDTLTMYIFAGEDPFFGDTQEGQATVETYCHLWTDRDRPIRDRMPVTIRKLVPAAGQIENVWRNRIQGSYMRLVPVRPQPDFGLGIQPTILVLDRDSEQVIPLLFDYTSDARVITGTGLVDCSLGFPQVNALFDFLVPDNDCRGRTSCLVRANGKHYVPGQTVMLYEGILVRLDEQDLDETTTEEATSTDYDPAASATSTPGISSDMSLRPGAPASEPNQTVNDALPLSMTTGPFFDLNQQGELIVVDQEIDPDTALQWFSAVAVQRTFFPQYDRMLAEFREGSNRGELHNAVFVIVGSEWNDAVYLSHLNNDEEHLMVLGQVRFALFDEFPVHVQLNLWLVHPNLRSDEQEGFRDRYILVDYNCPLDEIAVVVIVSDPEDAELDRIAIRVRLQMTNLLLFIQIGKTVKCTSEEFDCRVEHNGRSMPSGSYWPTYHGMKLRVNIQETSVKCPRTSAQGSERWTLGSARIMTDQTSGADESSLMQFFSTEEIQLVEEQHVEPSPFAQSYFGVIVIDSSIASESDILRTYIHDRKGETSFDAFTVYVWMLKLPEIRVVHTAQRCPCVRTQSYTQALLRLWQVNFPDQQIAVTLVHPDLQPLSLRAVPIDLIVVPEADISQHKHVFLIDVVGLPLPRRLAVFADEGTTVREIATLAGARPICDLSTTVCSLHAAAPPTRKVWNYDDPVTAEHGSGLVLWIQPAKGHQPVGVCEEGSNLMQGAQESVFPKPSTETDTTSFMQQTLSISYNLHDLRYFQAAVRLGYMHLWIHDVRQEENRQSQHRRVRWDRVRSYHELQKAVWLKRQETDAWHFQTIWPFPWMGGVPQPMTIFYQKESASILVLLIEVDSHAEHDVYSVALDESRFPCSVAFLFDLAIPDHACRRGAECRAKLEDNMYNFWVDIPVYAGAFVELTEIRMDSENESTTIEESCACEEESTVTEDETVSLTQLDITSLRFVRCPETGNPLSTRLQQQGIEDHDQHWNEFENAMFQNTEWHRVLDFQRELLAIGPLAHRDIKVYLFWYGDRESSETVELHWNDEWTAQTGLTTARAEIRRILWEAVPPGTNYLLGTSHPQPTTRQQHDRDDLYLVGQIETDSEVAVILVTNFNRGDADRYLIRTVKTPVSTNRDVILARLAMVGMCELVKCIVSSFGEIWEPGTEHMVYVGKRIDVEVRFDETADACMMSHEHLEEEHPITSDDEVSPSAEQLSPSQSHSADGEEALEDDLSLMQTERLYPDDGRSQRSGPRFHRCTTEKLAWLEPLRLRPVEMARCWDYRKVDYVVDHFSRQHPGSTHLQLTGWIFRSYNQLRGDTFAWGLNDRSPWHEQVSNLMQGKLEAGLMYTVIPQPSNLGGRVEKPITMQLLVPFQFDLPDVLLLVVENYMVVPSEAEAILCYRPCTVFSVFNLLGYSHWCDVGHFCIVTYKHGDCSMSFSDMDQLSIPTASRIYMSVKPKQDVSCMPQSAIGQASHQAKRIADLITRPGDRNHQRIFKSARRVLMHQPTGGNELGLDDSTLMQLPIGRTFTTQQGSDSESSAIGTRQATMSVSEGSSGPPPVGLQPNHDMAWHSTWQSARRHVTEYSRAEARRQIGRNSFVHLLICRNEDTRSIGTDCPDWILSVEQPLHHFTRWCQQFCQAVNMQLTRALPVRNELYQNAPSLIVMESTHADRVPIVIFVRLAHTTAVTFCVYEAARIERIAGILHWLYRNIIAGNMMAGNRLLTALNGRRVQGGDDAQFNPGDVLQVTALAHGDPDAGLDSTNEPLSSLDQLSHHTWASLPQVMPEAESLSSSGHEQEERTLDQIPRLHLRPVRNNPPHEPRGGHVPDVEDPANDETGLFQQAVSLATVALHHSSAETADPRGSRFLAQIYDLSWFPDEDEDWIALVVRRAVAANFWEFSRCIILLKPEDTNIPGQLDVRAVWDHPDHFDLSAILWNTWPELNNVRFRLHEVRSVFRLDQQDGLVTVLVRPNRGERNADDKIISIEVVRLQWGNLISRQTALTSPRRTTPDRLVQLHRIRDCSVFVCEMFLDGRPVAPQTAIELKNGDLATVVVSNENKLGRTFQTARMPFHAHWDNRRWRSQEQVFQKEGKILTFRNSERAMFARNKLQMSVMEWYTWEITMRLIEHQWTDLKYLELIRFKVHSSWRSCPELSSNLEVSIVATSLPIPLTRLNLIICRDFIAHQTQYWAQVVEAPLNEEDIIQLCGQTQTCADREVVCSPSWNRRPIRFAQQLFVEDGDILELDVTPRNPFCDIVDARPSLSLEGAATAFLQIRAHRISRHDRASFYTWPRSVMEGLRPPGNPVYWFVNKLNTMSRYVAAGEEIYVMDDVLKPATKISIQEALPRSLPNRPIPTPSRSHRACPNLSTKSVGLLRSQPLDALGFSEADRPVWDLSKIELEDHFRVAAQKLPSCQWTEDLFYADSFELYTDGSFDGEKAGWAVVLVVHWQDKTSVLGILSGAISQGFTTEIGVEIPKLSAQVAEQVALLWAHWWLLRFARSYGWQGQVYFRWDSVVPGKQTLGDYGTQTALGKLLRVLAVALEQQQGDTHIYHAHVRAHRGVLLNEVADAAAKLARIRAPVPPDGGKLVNMLGSLSDICHLWWFFCDPQFQTQLPSFSRSTGLLTWEPESQPALMREKIQAALTFGNQSEGTCFQECHFRFASYNALSLLDPQPPHLNQETGRARLLREQVHQQGIHLLGLQECRTATGAIPSATHMRLCSGAQSNGTLGVELWIATKVPVNHKRCLDVRDFMVLHADPRCLLVHYEGEFGAMLILVAHAPHTGHTVHERANWWSTLLALVRQHRRSLHVISLIDANATWAGPANDQMGDLCEVASNSNTPLLIDFVEQMDLFAPATFSDCQTGPWFTWTHAQTGKEHRIDYVLLPSAWMQAWIQTWTDSSIPVGHAGIDHVATIAEVYWEQKCGKPGKKVRYDRDAILNPKNREKVFQILNDCPKPAWGVNASDHAVTLSKYLQDAVAMAFPAPKRKTPKYTKEETRDIYQRLVSAKRACTQFRMIMYFGTLTKAFRAWSNQTYPDVTRVWSHRFNCKFARVTKSVQKLTEDLRLRLRKDKLEFLEELAKEVNECPPSEVFKKLRPVLKPAKRQSQVVQPLPKLVDLDGKMILSRAQQTQRWTEHFASIEAGHTVDAPQFVDEQLKRQSERCKPSSFQNEDIPTIDAIESAIRAAHRDKAAGPDGLPAEIFKAIPGKASRLLYPLALKLALRIEEPIAWKGGYLFPLYKGKGSMSECSNHRGILLMDVMGKLTRAGLRRWINAPYIQNGHSMQLGGRPHQQAQFGAQLTRSFLRWRKTCNKSAAVLFVDIASAFYKALREIATGADVSDQDIAKVAQRLGIGPEVMPALHQALLGRSSYASLTSSVPRQQVLQESLSGTWFSVDGSTVVATEQGTRPGDSWADVVFNVLLSQVLLQAEKVLQEEGITTTIPVFERSPCPQQLSDRTVSLLQVTWADDIAMMVSLQTPSAVWKVLPRATQVLIDELQAIGMEISCGANKTAALVLLRGSGSVPVRRKLFKQQQAELPIVAEKQGLMLPLVPHYKHLGGILSFKGNLSQEIATRYAKARQAYWRAAKTIFRPAYISFSIKMQLFRSIVLSVYTWGIGAWPALSAADLKKYTTSYWNLWRLCLGRMQKHASKGEVCSLLGCSEPEDVLQAARARHYVAMYQHAPDPVWSVVHLDSSTAQAYQDAIDWIHEALQRERGFEGLTAQEACRQACATQGASWKAAVKRASERWRQFKLREAKVADFHRRILAVLSSPLLEAKKQQHDSWAHFCLPCRKGFHKKNAWFLHASIVHSYRTMEGEAVQGTTCWCCAKQYTTTLSLKHHLRYSQVCCTYFWKNRDILQEVDPGQRHPQFPWVRTGEPEIQTVEKIHRDKVQLRQDLEQVLKEFMPPECDAHLVPELTKAFTEVVTRIMPVQDILAVLKEMAEEFDQPNQMDIQEAFLQARQAVQHFLSSKERIELQPDLLLTEAERTQISIAPVEARPSLLFREVYVLHLFSGRRRIGDLQTALEAIALPTGTNLFVISLDVMVSPKHGDLTNRKQQDDIIALIRAGAIAAAFAGPPCETWSVARFEKVKGRRKPPRPLRTSTQLWGLVDISFREGQQVEIGNDLMGFAILVMLEVAISGGFAVLEHPLDPLQLRTVHQQAPSVWRTSLMKWMRQAGLFHELRVAQGHFGAKSAKPTNLLIAGLKPEVITALEQDSRTHSCPQTSSIGLCSDGWSTSSLKEYPKDFCVFLARLFQTWMEGTTRKAGPPDADVAWLHEMHVVQVEQHEHEGPDFHPPLIKNSSQQGAESPDTVR